MMSCLRTPVHTTTPNTGTGTDTGSAHKSKGNSSCENMSTSTPLAGQKRPPRGPPLLPHQASSSASRSSTRIRLSSNRKVALSSNNNSNSSMNRSGTCHTSTPSSAPSPSSCLTPSTGTGITITTAITARDIQRRITTLFGGVGGGQPGLSENNGSKIKSKSGATASDNEYCLTSCVSARLFACYSLHVPTTTTTTKDKEDKSAPMSTSTPSRSTRQSKKDDACQHSQLQPILPFLQALVHVEVVSHGNSSDNSSSSNNSSSNNSNSNSTKRTHFSGFDCSSTQPPVDRVDGSNTHQQDSIEALVAAKEQVQVLALLRLGMSMDCAGSDDVDVNVDVNGTGMDTDTKENDTRHDVENWDASTTTPATTTPAATPTLEQVCSCLQALIQFLTDTMLARAGYGLMLRQECAKSIAVHYPPRRVEKAVIVYKNELETILARLQATSTTEIFTLNYNNNINSQVLFVEQRLAEFVGQAVRYNLRRFFNQAPPRLTPADTNYEQRLGAYSQVYALVEMEMDEEYENAAVDDACISALVSTALCRIYEFFGLEALLDSSQQQPSLPYLFCQKPATNRGFVGRSSITDPLTEDDMADILDDVDEATGFLAAAKGCRFLLDLFQIQGVQDEIARQGGWLEVETHASISWKYDLWKLCPADAHLVVLCNYDSFLAKIESLVPLMEDQVSACQASLDALAKRFHISTKSKNLLKKYPQIPDLASHLEEALVRAHSFPLIKEMEY